MITIALDLLGDPSHCSQQLPIWKGTPLFRFPWTNCTK